MPGESYLECIAVQMCGFPPSFPPSFFYQYLVAGGGFDSIAVGEEVGLSCELRCWFCWMFHWAHHLLAEGQSSAALEWAGNNHRLWGSGQSSLLSRHLPCLLMTALTLWDPLVSPCKVSRVLSLLSGILVGMLMQYQFVLLGVLQRIFWIAKTPLKVYTQPREGEREGRLTWKNLICLLWNCGKEVTKASAGARH